MNKMIVYKNDDGAVVLVIPSPDCGLTVEKIALKDVPVGKPFKIMDASEVPEDTTAWVVDDADLTDGVGADYGIGSNNPFILQGV